MKLSFERTNRVLACSVISSLSSLLNQFSVSKLLISELYVMVNIHSFYDKKLLVDFLSTHSLDCLSRVLVFLESMLSR